LTTSPLLARPDAARPRVHSAPAYDTSAGQEATELAASAGLFLDPWQRLALIDALGERPDGRWSAFEVGLVVPRQNGKGAVLEARELAGLFLFGEQLLFHTAHEVKTSLEAFRRVLALIEGSDDLRRRVKRVDRSNGEEGIELQTGARLRFVARSKGSGRGFSADLVIWDEAYALTTAQVEAQLPTMSARPNPQLWYTSSPPLDAVTGAVLMAVRKRGLAGAPGLAWLDYGAEPTVDLDDRAAWKRHNPGWGLRIGEEFIAAERSAMTPEGFGRERLGIWPADSDEQWQVIPEAEWRAGVVEDEERPAGPVAFAVEVTLDRSWASIGVAGKRADGLRQVELVDHRPGTGWIVERVKELRAAWKTCAVVVAKGGPAASVIADLEAGGVEVLTPTLQEFAAAAGACYDGFCGDRRDVRYVESGPLTAAVAGAAKRPLADGAWTFGRLRSSVDVSPLMAVALALHGYAVKGPSGNYDPLANFW
jgi:hypothetical protein